MDTASSMTVMPSQEELARLRALVPLHTLPDDALSELAASASFESVRKGELLFEEGDTDHENVYLIEGTVVLLSNGKVVDSIKSDSETARFPLAHQLPRKHGVRAKSKLRVVRFDSRLLSEVVARSRTVDYQVDSLEEASEDDWMSMLLQSRVLQQVPASNIQRVMMNVEQVEVAKGDDLIRQGDAGDYYYMLTRGRAVVRRDRGDGNGPTELATLGPGDAFGEEALLSDKPRNSTVSMLNDGHVLRLSKDNFLDLIHNPLLDRLDRRAAQAKVDAGALWLDLRSSEQYDTSHLPGAINFPFESLRYQAASLAPDRHYVLYSNTGGRAMAGAFLLTERGFEVSVMDEGVTDDALARTDIPPLATSAVESESIAAVTAVEDEVVQERVREAELRAKALEERLKIVELDQETTVAEREQQLEQVRYAVDQAKRKLLETEQQKHEALEERQKAYAELERLNSSLEEVRHERASLLGRVTEVEDLDQQLHRRLAKAERELIGERERAESAASSLEDLSARLSELQQQRDEERQQHAQERGELKEELTALRLEFEQSQFDLEELRESLAAKAGEIAEDESAAAEAAGAFAETRSALEVSRRQTGELSEELSALKTQLTAAQAEVDSLRQDLAAREAGNADLRARIDGLLADGESAQTRLGELEGQRNADHDQAESRIAELEQALRESEAQAAELTALQQEELQRLQIERVALQDTAASDLAAAMESKEMLQQSFDDYRRQGEQADAVRQQELEQLRADYDALQSQVSEGSAEAGAAVEQARSRVADLEVRLEEEQQQAAQALEARQAEFDDVQATLQAERDGQADILLKAEQAIADANQIHEERAQLLAERDILRDKMASQQQDAEQLLLQAQADAEQKDAELQQAQDRIAMLEQQLQSSTQQAGEDQASAATRLAEAQTAITEQEQALQLAVEQQQDLQSQLEQARSEQQETVSKLEALQSQLSEQQRSTDEALQAASEVAETARGDLEQLRTERDEAAAQHAAEFETLKSEMASRNAEEENEREDLQRALTELQAENNELQQRLEEREMALAGARQEQSELIEALNAAGSERETLQFAVTERDDEQARLFDLENRLADAIRTQENELLAHEQQQRELNNLLAQTQEEVERLQGQLDKGGSPQEQALIEQRDALIADLAVRDTEVEQLRGVMEEYVDRIRGAQPGDTTAEIEALRAELEMVREQAIQDVVEMRERLAAAETQKRRLQEADGREAISLESMRQQIEALGSSLSERQRELAEANHAQQELEDELEDGNRQLDALRRDLEKAQVEADEATYSRREAESARDQLQQALYQLQENADESKVTDLRDDRMVAGGRPIGIESGSSGIAWISVLLGAGLAIGILEAVSLMTGRGELFSALMRLAG